MARRLLPVPGFAPIRGDKARRYINQATGQIISRGAHQTQQYGMTAKQHAQEMRDIRAAQGHKVGKKSRYGGFVDAYKAKTAAALGIPKSKVKVRGDSDQARKFRELYARLKVINKRGNADKSPGGELATILEELNLREKDAPYPVNHSPDKDVR